MGAGGHMQTTFCVLEPLCVVPLSVLGATPFSTQSISCVMANCGNGPWGSVELMPQWSAPGT